MPWNAAGGSGDGARNGASPARNWFTARFCRALSAAASQRAHACTISRRGWTAVASCRRSRPQAHAGVVRTGAGDHGHHTGRNGAAAGDRPFRLASGARGGGAGGRGVTGFVRSPPEPAAVRISSLSERWSRARISRADGSLARSAAAITPWTSCWPAAGAPMLRKSCAEPGLRAGGRSPGCRTAGAIFGRAGIRVPVALRRFRIAGAGSDAVRRVRVIASRAVAEAAGDAAIYAGYGPGPGERHGRCWRQRPELAAERAAAVAGARREFSWERTARLTRQVYEEARARFGA